MKHFRNCVDFHRYLVFLGKSLNTNSLPAAIVYSANVDKMPCGDCSRMAQLEINGGRYQINKSSDQIDRILPELARAENGGSDEPF
jgi:hypothetical protein